MLNSLKPCHTYMSMKWVVIDSGASLATISQAKAGTIDDLFEIQSNSIPHLLSGKCLLKWCLHMLAILPMLQCVNTLRPRQNGHRFPDDFFKRIFMNENVWVLIKISLKFVPEGSISNIPALVQIMAWRRPGDKPLSEPMVVNLLTHKCVTRPQCVNAVVPQMEGDKLACTLSRPICNLHKTDEPTAQNLLWLAVWHNS